MKRMITNILILFIGLLDSAFSKRADYVVFNSFPDVSDNAFALFLHVIKFHADKKCIWLVRNMKEDKYKV
jgi:CDP-glycerol glycerophosphotransferase (TagB/SpsB family)